MPICIECKEPIRPEQEREDLPGKEVIHQSCIDAILDRPIAVEKEPTNQGSASREWMI